MPQPPDEIELQPVNDVDDVDAHLFKEALAAGVVAGALFAGTAQAKTLERGPSTAAPAAKAHAAARLVFDGGTPVERLQVTKALAASTFDWGLLPSVNVHITADPLVEALPGDVWFQSSLLDSGRFSWGVVQHEFAHQVDFLLLNDAARAQLTSLLGGSAWCLADAPGLRHSDYTCERFASTLAWAYWQSSDNCMKPQGRTDVESGSVSPGAFRQALAAILGG